MKKIFLIIMISFLWSNVVFAKVLKFVCEEKFYRSNGGKIINTGDLLLLRIDLDKNEIWEYDDTNIDYYKFKIDPERSNYDAYVAWDYVEEMKQREKPDTAVEFNRWTGEYQSDRGGSWGFSRYWCKPINKRLY